MLAVGMKTSKLSSGKKETHRAFLNEQIEEETVPLAAQSLRESQ